MAQGTWGLFFCSVVFYLSVGYIYIPMWRIDIIIIIIVIFIIIIVIIIIIIIIIVIINIHLC